VLDHRRWCASRHCPTTPRPTPIIVGRAARDVLPSIFAYVLSFATHRSCIGSPTGDRLRRFHRHGVVCERTSGRPEPPAARLVALHPVSDRADSASKGDRTCRCVPTSMRSALSGLAGIARTADGVLYAWRRGLLSRPYRRCTRALSAITAASRSRSVLLGSAAVPALRRNRRGVGADVAC
jgi:hypothetical protein